MSGTGIFSPPLMTRRTDDRSRSSMPGKAMMALTIAGASQTTVTRERSISSTTAAASNDAVDDGRRPGGDERCGRQIERADVVERAAREAEIRAGEAELHQVREFFHARLACVSMTPFGRPVVPDVYMSRCTSSGPRRAAGRRIGVRSVGQRLPSAAAPATTRTIRARPSSPSVACVGEIDQRGVAHERPGLRMFEDVAHLRRGQPPVDRHRDSTEVVGGEDRLRGTRAVVGQQRHDIALPDAPARQAAGQSSGACRQLPVRRRLALEDGQRLVRACASRGGRGPRTS